MSARRPGRVSGVVRLLASAAAVTTPAGVARAAPGPSTGGVYQDECGACHVAYPARLQRPAEWSRVLAGLDRHYGVDASLDDRTLAAVASQLGTPVAKSSSGAQAAALPRITTSPWFTKEHREVAAAQWRSPKVKSAANCGACHAGAAQGNFEEPGEGRERSGRGAGGEEHEHQREHEEQE